MSLFGTSMCLLDIKAIMKSQFHTCFVGCWCLLNVPDVSVVVTEGRLRSCIVISLHDLVVSTWEVPSQRCEVWRWHQCEVVAVAPMWDCGRLPRRSLPQRPLAFSVSFYLLINSQWLTFRLQVALTEILLLWGTSKIWGFLHFIYCDLSWDIKPLGFSGGERSNSSWWDMGVLIISSSFLNWILYRRLVYLLLWL